MEMMQTDLSQLLSFRADSPGNGVSTAVSAAPPAPPTSPDLSGIRVPVSVLSPTEPTFDQQVSDTAAGADSGNDRVEITGEKPDSSRQDQLFEDVARKTKDLPTPEQISSANIVRIVSENAPHVLQTLRAILATRLGLEPPQPASDTVSDETGGDSSNEVLPSFPAPEGTVDGSTVKPLEDALTAAAGSPDPSRRVAAVVEGAANLPEKVRDTFYKAATHLLKNESAVVRRDLVSGQTSPVAVDPSSGVYSAEGTGTRVGVKFDLFYSISSRYAVQAGKDASGSFYEATAAVEAKFGASFSLEIGGRFLSLADAASKVDPTVLDAFSEAVSGLAGLDENALDRFFKATESLFSAVEDSLELADGSLDGVATEVKETAKSFFAAVSSATADTFPGVDVSQIFSLPEGLDSNGTTPLLDMLLGALEQGDVSPTERLLAALTGAENGRAAAAQPPSTENLPNLPVGSVPGTAQGGTTTADTSAKAV